MPRRFRLALRNAHRVALGVAPEHLQKLADLRAALAFVAQGEEHDESQLLSLGDLRRLKMSLVRCTEG